MTRHASFVALLYFSMIGALRFDKAIELSSSIHIVWSNVELLICCNWGIMDCFHTTPDLDFHLNQEPNDRVARGEFVRI